MTRQVSPRRASPRRSNKRPSSNEKEEHDKKTRRTDDNANVNDTQTLNEILHHLSVITTNSINKSSTSNYNKVNDKYLEQLEESGFMETTLWPYFLQHVHDDNDDNNDATLSLSQCAYLLALLVNQRCNLRGNGSKGSSTSGPLSFIYEADSNDVHGDGTNNKDNDDKDNANSFDKLLQHLINYNYKSNSNSNKIEEETNKVKFLIIAYTSLTKHTKSSIKKSLLKVVNIGLWSCQSLSMPIRYRDLELRKHGAFRRQWGMFCESSAKDDKKDGATGNEKMKLYFYIPHILGLFLSNLNQFDLHTKDDDDDDDGDNDDYKNSRINTKNMEFLYVVLQFILDLLSTTATRRYLRPYLLSINFSVKCTISSIFKSFLNPPNSSTSRSTSDDGSRLFVQLVTMLQDLETFSIQDISSKPLSKAEMASLYHDRAHVLQKIAHRYYKDGNDGGGNVFSELIYAGVGMVCDYVFLKRNLERIVDADVLIDVAHRLRLIQRDGDDNGNGDEYLIQRENEEEGEYRKRKKEYVTQVMLYHHTLRPTEEQTLSQLPLYPDEKLLWNPHLVPPGNAFKGGSSSLSSSTTLALPKLNTQFLTFGDYLLRSFKLLRLESAYEIRSDLVDVIKRMRPVPRHGYGDDDHMDDAHLDEEELWNKKRKKTEFHGWSRMGLELTDNVSCPVKLIKVAPPKLGESIPSKVLAEITLDLKRCGESIRREWDEIGEFDNLFMVAVDATKMKGGAAPTMESGDGNMNMKESRSVPDEEDVSFPQRFGIVAVRGCMVLEVRDTEGNILSNPNQKFSKDRNDNDEKVSKPKNFKRYLTVSLDPAQYAADATGNGSALGTKVYQMLNVVVRRKGKENNFKAVLETVRGLMQGSASVNRSIPSWLQPVFLGYGDPSSASFLSKNMRSFAMNTTGVSPPDAALDYGDTFLDEVHLRESFPESKIEVDGREKTIDKAIERNKYRIKIINDPSAESSSDSSGSIVTANSYPFSTDVNGNPVRFTPVQVKAIRSGLNPGLTLIVGPPGTGKTDVAVQIIANLYHSFPSQRTVLVTHSNAALNDLFTKVMARGDVDERHMLRLGSGERDLQTESDFDFTKLGRVNYILSRRAKLLEEVQLLSESLGVSGAAERGPDGSPSYTCETAEYFHLHHVKKRIQIFHANVKGDTDTSEASNHFPFKKYFGLVGDKLSFSQATKKFDVINQYFAELAEYRPLELLRSQRQRTDYLLTKQARIVAMTCTHAAIARSHLVELGFQYDNIVMEEAGQMLDIETFTALLLQRGETGNHSSSESRLKRISLIGDHHQLPPVVKNISFSKYSNLDQSLFTRLIRLGVPSIDLNKQGRARPEIAKLYSWRYNDLGNLDHVSVMPDFLRANAGFLHTHQIINVEDYEGRGESTPTAYFYQNVGEAEFSVALFQYMVLIGYPPEKISILTTYNGQKDLLNDIISQRCGVDTPLGGVRPGAISTVDHYQGQQNDFVILSLVRTKSVGHLRDIRRLIVAVSRARLGLYIVCRQNVFSRCHELHKVMDQFAAKPNKLELITGEQYPTERSLGSGIPTGKMYTVDDVMDLGSIVHAMQQEITAGL